MQYANVLADYFRQVIDTKKTTKMDACFACKRVGLTSRRFYCVRNSIRTHLAYIANVKKSCYTKQQSHSFESARSLTSFTTEK